MTPHLRYLIAKGIGTIPTHFETVCKETAAKIIPLKPKLKNEYPGKQIISVKTVKYYTKQRDINNINRHHKMSDI